MEREDDELALSELLASLWQYKKTLLICVLFGVVLALLAWISTPVTTGVTYRLSIYPDGAPMYSRDAIAAQLTSALSSAGYSPSRARDGTITVKTFGADDDHRLSALQ